MILVKLGLLLVGFIYAGLLPFTVRRTLQHLNFNLKKETLSFLSNKYLYDEKYVSGYKRILFIAALLNYSFFWLLSRLYNLGENVGYMRHAVLCFALLTFLAFIPHNILPYSLLKRPGATLQRLLHNILGMVVFLMLPILSIIFQVLIIKEMFFLGISGLIIITSVVIISFYSLFKNGITGVTEILFINGICIWTIYITIYTFVVL